LIKVIVDAIDVGLSAHVSIAGLSSSSVDWHVTLYGKKKILVKKKVKRRYEIME
jgi:hypothetical protein